MEMANRSRLDNPFRDEKIARIRDELKVRNEVKVGAWFLVRVPKIDGRIYLRNQAGKRTYVELIYDNRYDPETQKTRNRRVSIGQLLDWFPGAMIPNEKYYEFFDRETGELKERSSDSRVGAPAVHNRDGGTESQGNVGAPAVHNRDERTNGMVGDAGSTQWGRFSCPNPYMGHGRTVPTVPPGEAALLSLPEAGELKERGEEDGPTGSGELKEEGRDDVDRKLRDAIANVLERENLIRPSERQMQDRIRKSWETEDDAEGCVETENGGRSETVSGIADGSREGTAVPGTGRKRVRILLDILTGLRDVIKDQARKRPGEIINGFQVEKINSVLREIKRIEDQKGFGDLLEMIRMPEEDVDEDGNLVLTGGMTYSDAEVLLEYYNSVIWFTQGDREMG